MAVVTATELRKSYGPVRALDGLGLAVAEGELYGVLGPNGAGKTTLLEVLTGQLRPDAGAAEVLGFDPVDSPIEVRERVGILPEQGRPPSFLTPREYFSFVGSVRGLPEDVIEDRRDTWADRLGYGEKLDTYCTDLSRGQQQKVLVTATFLHDPDLAFIDEPLANLDPIIQERLKDHFREYVAGGNTLMLSTHNIDVAAELCSRVGIVTQGKKIDELAEDEIGDADELLETFLANVEG